MKAEAAKDYVTSLELEEKVANPSRPPYIKHFLRSLGRTYRGWFGCILRRIGFISRSRRNHLPNPITGTPFPGQVQLGQLFRVHT